MEAYRSQRKQILAFQNVLCISGLEVASAEISQLLLNTAACKCRWPLWVEKVAPRNRLLQPGYLNWFPYAIAAHKTNRMNIWHFLILTWPVVCSSHHYLQLWVVTFQGPGKGLSQPYYLRSFNWRRQGLNLRPVYVSLTYTLIHSFFLRFKKIQNSICRDIANVISDRVYHSSV